MSDAEQTEREGPWYRDGLRFECRPDCGVCCTNHEDYAYVYLADGDLERMAELLQMTPEAFEEQYTTSDDGWTVLRMDEPDCPFLEQGRCRVYEARPTQCRTFPFWPENLSSAVRWRRLRRFCPGVDSGDLHPLRVIRSHLVRHRRDL
jgi:Fe-S-cluster containining protein